MGLVHIVFDSETLGVRENAVVLSIACVPFELEVYQNYSDLYSQGYSVKFDSEEQMKVYKRTTERDTIQWWLKQPAEVRRAVTFTSAFDVPMKKGLQYLTDFVRSTSYDYKASYVWARGSYFDFPKIESMYLQAGLPLPYNSWKIRDIRTYVDILTGSNDGKYILQKGKSNSYRKHNALCDAAYDAAVMVEIYHRIKDLE